MYLQSAPGLSMDQPTPCCGKKLPPPNSGQRKFLGTKRPKPREPFSLYASRVKKNSGMLSDGVSARTKVATKPASALRASARRTSVFCMWRHCIVSFSKFTSRDVSRGLRGSRGKGLSTPERLSKRHIHDKVRIMAAKWTMLLSFLGLVLPLQTATKSVWDGAYTNAQAERGQKAYTEHCAGCHQSDLGGKGEFPALKGNTFMDRWHD